MELKQQTFIELIREKCETRGSLPALEFQGEFYTWSEIDALSDIVAKDLVELGAGLGSHICICGKNSANWIITYFAIHKLGGIAVLLNFALKENEIVRDIQTGDVTFFCCGDCSGIQTDPDTLDRIQISSDGTLKGVYHIESSIFLKDRLPELDGEEPSQSCHNASPGSTACMLFTSGSTGTPKGVLLSHYSVLNNAQIVGELLHLDSRDSICLALPLFHSFGMTCGMLACLVSNTIIHIPKSLHIPDILDTISRYQCTVFHAVPAMFLSMVTYPDFYKFGTDQIRVSMIGGAPVLPAQLARFQAGLPNDQFLVSYGMTETAPWVSSTLMNDTKEHLETTVGPIGPGQDAMIQDLKTGRPCRSGITGELCLKGYNVMQGYYKYPPNLQPFDSKGWLHTGDLGFFDVNGYLHLTGRKKELIIRSGENIAPPEVEAALLEEPSITDVKVLGVPSEATGEEVVACIVVSADIPFDEAAVRESLLSRLAKFKIPSYFLIYPVLPTLSNGKVDAVGLWKDVTEKVKVLRST